METTIERRLQTFEENDEEIDSDEFIGDLYIEPTQEHLDNIFYKAVSEVTENDPERIEELALNLNKLICDYRSCIDYLIAYLLRKRSNGSQKIPNGHKEISKEV